MSEPIRFLPFGLRIFVIFDFIDFVFCAGKLTRKLSRFIRRDNRKYEKLFNNIIYLCDLEVFDHNFFCRTLIKLT